MVCTLGFFGEIADFRDVFKFHAYCEFVLVLDDRNACWNLPDLTTSNVCKVDTSNRNHIERSR